MIPDALLSAIRKAETIALIAHIMPDGDTIGSCLALADGLASIGKKVNLYCQDNIPSVLDFLAGVDQFKSDIDAGVSYDLAIAVDCSDIERMGSCSVVFEKSGLTACIDHHVSNTGFAQINYIEVLAAATGEIVYLILSDLVPKINKAAADAIYTAICTDTGSFAYSSTTSRTYRIAADMLDCGVETDKITTALYKTNSLEKIKLLAKTLNTLSLHENNKVAVLTMDYDTILSTGAKEFDSESIVNYAKEIKGVELGFLVKETSLGNSKVSFRSKDIVNVSKLAAKFGGGGHIRAAGASIHADTAAAKEMVLDEVSKLFKELKL